MPPLSSLPAFGRREEENEENRDELWSRIIEWSVREYEEWKGWREDEEDEADLAGHSDDRKARDSPDARHSPEHKVAFTRGVATTRAARREGADRFPLFFASTLSSLLALLDIFPPQSSSTPVSPFVPPNRTQSTLFSHLPHVPPLLRSSFSPSSSLSPAIAPADPSHRLHLLDALSRLFLHAYRTHRESLVRDRSEARRKKRETKERDERDWRERVEERLRGLEGEMLGTSGVEDGAWEERRGGLPAQLGAFEDQVERLAGLLQVSVKEQRTERARQLDWRLRVGAAFVAGLAVGAAVMAATSVA